MKYWKLPKEFAEKWVAALRSGEYAQTTGRLADLDDEDREPCAYCCLGVATIILDGTATFLDPTAMRDSNYIHEYFMNTNTNIEVPEDLKSPTGYELSHTLSVLNDGVHIAHKHSLNSIQSKYPGIELKQHAYTFPEIADFIETYCEFVEESTQNKTEDE